MLFCELEDKKTMVEMVLGAVNVDKTLSNDPIRRLCALVDCSRPHGVSSNVPLDRVCKILNEMYEMATVYTRENKMEKAFILYLRFVGIVVEELPKHKDFGGFTPSEKENYDRLSIRAMNAAETLKRQIKANYEREARECRPKKNAKNNLLKSDEIFAGPAPVIPVMCLNLKSYVVCQKPTFYSLLFQRIIVPNNLPEKFLDSFNKDETDKFAILYGKLLRNSLIVSHVLVTDGSAASIEQLDRCIIDPDVTDPTEVNELLVVGCICGSLTNTAVEYFVSKSLLTEIVIIVCNKGDRQTYVLHLSNMPERNRAENKEVDQGNTKLNGDVDTSPAGNQSNSLIDSSQNVCSHTHISSTLSCTILDTRHERENILHAFTVPKTYHNSDNFSPTDPSNS